jgi:lysophospholipase L1-like esterase
MKKLYSCLAMFSMALSASAATSAPKVVFIGDYITHNWTSGFAANPNWINQGVNGAGLGNQQQTYDVVAAIAQHPAVIHILIGANLSVNTPPHDVPGGELAFASTIDAMVKQIQAAHIKVILGLTPSAGSISFGDYDSGFYNEIIAAYGAAQGITVVNYANAMCQCISDVDSTLVQVPNGNQQMASIPSPNPSIGPQEALLPTAAGYAIMTTLAETAIADQYLTIESGYLQNVELPVFTNDFQGAKNVATCTNTCEIQFTPIGYYSDGSTHPQINTTLNGNDGTWTSSNPLVVSVNQQGLANALTPGTAIIKYIPANGMKFNEWIMTIGEQDESIDQPPVLWPGALISKG